MLKAIRTRNHRGSEASRPPCYVARPRASRVPVLLYAVLRPIHERGQTLPRTSPGDVPSRVLTVVHSFHESASVNTV